MISLEVYRLNFQYKYDWILSTPEDQGMNSTLLVQMEEYFESNASYNIDSFLIIRHGRLVYEYYADSPSTGVEKTHHIFSVTKSIVSAMIGIVVDQGLLRVSDYVLGLFS